MNFDIFRAARGLDFPCGTVTSRTSGKRCFGRADSATARAAMTDLAGRRRAAANPRRIHAGEACPGCNSQCQRRRGPGAFCLNQGKMAFCHFLAVNRETFRGAHLSIPRHRDHRRTGLPTWVAPSSSVGLHLLRCGGHCAAKFPSRVVTGLAAP